MNKTESFYVRLTADEKTKLKERASKLGYDNFSRFILDAALGETLPCSASMKLDLLTRWYDTYHAIIAELSRIGGNLNQLARYENTLQYSGVLNPNIIDENLKLRKECQELFSSLKSFNDTILKELKKIR